MAIPEHMTPTADVSAALIAPCECGHRFGVHAMVGCRDCLTAAGVGLGEVIPPQVCRKFRGIPDGGPPLTRYTLAEVTEAMRTVMHTVGDQAKMAAVIAQLREIR